MIYLIDDKDDRRKGYGWSDDRLKEFSESIKVISSQHLYDDFISGTFVSDDVFLYHESFALSLEVDTNYVNSQIQEIVSTYNISVVYFSGSNSSRRLNEQEKTCVLPVAVLYNNLGLFIKEYQNNNIDLKVLVYGTIADKAKEDALRSKLEQVPVISRKSDLTSFLFKNSEFDKPKPFENSVETVDWWEKDCTDAEFIKSINDYLSSTKYDIIFVPLCLGATLTDYLGLRLAMLIRLLDTPNRLADICIYGEANILDFCSNECFDILKMPGVKYSSYKFESVFGDKEHLENISESDYRLGLKNIKLDVPSNIGDNHSISNLWSIYRWAETIEDEDGDDSDINKVKNTISYSLYFKYLQALYPITSECKLSKKHLKVEEAKENPKLNVLLVDDEADKGWYEIFCRILCDEPNSIKFNYLGDEIKGLSQDDIINKAINKIKDCNANVVILDYRLTLSDFGPNKTVESITGYKLLKQIKNLNRGIQVVVFSATNKIWNWKALEALGCDGFILKESPSNSVDKDFTSNTICQFVNTITKCSQQTYKIEIWEKLQKLKKKIQEISDSELDIYKGTLDNLLLMTEDVMFVRNSEYPLPQIFINMFRIAEVICNNMIDLEKDSRAIYYYVFKDDGERLRKYTNDALLDPDYRNRYILSCKAHKTNELSNINKICNGLAHLKAYDVKMAPSIKMCVKKRNDFTHPNNGLPYISVSDVKNIFDIVYKLIMFG